MFSFFSKIETINMSDFRSLSIGKVQKISPTVF